MPSRLSTLASLVLSAVAVCIAWRRYWLGDRSPFQTDIEFYHHPVTHELARAWSEGRIPLWTDAVYCGFPFFVDTQTAAWYPGTLLVVALGPHAGYVAFVLLHAWIAAVGGFALARLHGVAAPGALAAACIVPLSGYLVYETQHPGLFAILCWIPLWLAATRRVFLRPGAGNVALAGLPMALMVFAGTLQVLFGAALLYGAYLLALCLGERTPGGPRRALRGLLAVAASQVLGLALCAVAWVPGLAHYPHTARALGMDYALASIGSVPPAQLLGLFVNRAEQMLAGGTRLDFEGASLYVGALVLPLALLGLASARRTLAVSLGLGVAALALVASGRHAPLYPWLFEVAPGVVGSLRGMGRATGPLVVGLALLAALGIEAARGDRGRRRLLALLAATLGLHGVVLAASDVPVPARSLGSLVALAAALGAVALGARRPAWIAPVLTALFAVDLLAFGAVDDVTARSPRPPSERQQAGTMRLPLLADLARDPSAREGRIALLGPLGGDNFTFLQGLDGLTGYNPLVTLQYVDFVHRVDTGARRPRVPLAGYVHDEVPSRVGSGLFQAAAVRFLISPGPLEAPGLRLVERSWNPVTRDPVLLYEPEQPLPRSYLAQRTRRARSADHLDALLGSDFDPREATVFEGEAPELDGPPGIAAVEQTRLRPEHLVFDVATDAPALLVVADSWYPGWVATVDGAPAPVLRVNGSFRGVPMDAGARKVEMRFEPASFRTGATVSLAAAAVWIALVAVPRFRRTTEIW